MPLKWNGPAAEGQAIRRLSNALGDIGLDVEGEAKKELYKGHGVLTGTLRRSIHSAGPGYNWPGDDVAPAEGTPERGGQAATPEPIGRRLVVAVGSGLVYAMAVHQGHHSFEGYHYITNAVEKVRPRVLQHIARHRND
jgi:hypothetical protein